jgi:hypothetical protein
MRHRLRLSTRNGPLQNLPSPLAGEGAKVLKQILLGEGVASKEIAEPPPHPFIFA